MKIWTTCTSLIVMVGAVTLPVEGVIVVQDQSGIADGINSASNSVGNAMRVRNERNYQEQLRLQLEQERQIAAEIEFYNTVSNQLACSATHPELTIPEDLTTTSSHTHYLNMSKNRRVTYTVKKKLQRVVGNGTLAEWTWSLDLRNSTKKKLLSSGKIQCERARIEIQLVDDTNMVLASCVVHTRLNLARDDSTNLSGRWFIPYDQVQHLSSCKVKIT